MSSLLGCEDKIFDAKPQLVYSVLHIGLALKFEIEYWSSLDTKYVILEIEAESESDAVNQFKNMHPHKKFRVLDPLDD